MGPPLRSGHRLWARRIGWLVLIWMSSVIALAIVAMVLRTFMSLVGLSA